MTCTYIQHMEKSNFSCIIEGPIVSCAKWADRITPSPSLFKKYPPLLKNFLLMFSPYLLFALTNPVYLLLTDKTNRAGTKVIIHT